VDPEEPGVTASFEIYLIAGIYLVWVFGKGILASCRIHNLEDYLLGGRSLGAGLLAATLAATLLGGGASLGIFGRAYTEGPFFLFSTLGWYLAIILTGLWLAAPIRHSGKATVGEFVTARYGPGLGRACTWLSLVYSLGLLAAQLAALREVGRILLPGVRPEWILAVGTSVILLYNWAGGFWAVVKTDQIQFFVLAGGFAVLAVLAGRQGWTAAIPPQWTLGAEGVVWLFPAFFLGEFLAPAYFMRFAAARSSVQAVRGTVLAGAGLACFFFPLFFWLVAYARGHIPGLEPGQALPSLVASLGSAWLSGVMLAALLAAVMSSADSILNASTLVVMHDFHLHKIFNPLRLARWVCLALGASAAGVAWLLPNILQLLLLSYQVWAPAVTVLLAAGLLGFLIPRGAAWVIFSTGLGTSLGTGIFGGSSEQAIVIGAGVSLAAAIPAVWACRVFSIFRILGGK